MEGSYWNLFAAMVAAAVFVWQVDLFCDWLVLPYRHRWEGLLLAGMTVVTFVVTLVNAYLFMRS